MLLSPEVDEDNQPALSHRVGTFPSMENFDLGHLAQLRASAASAGLARDDALAVLDELDRLREALIDQQRTVQALRVDLSQAVANVARWKGAYQTAVDEREDEADRTELLRAELARQLSADDPPATMRERVGEFIGTPLDDDPRKDG